MQNISIIKLANAIKHLENDVSRYDQLLNAQNITINDLSARLQTVQTQPAPSEPASRGVHDETSVAISELNETVQNLKSDIMEAINEAPVLTYDESMDSNDEMSSKVETSSTYKTVDSNDEKYSSYGSVSDIMVINLGNTKLSVDKDDKENEICSITNESGGLAFRKNDSSDVWLLDRSSDSEIAFHFNNVENTPVSITPNGIKTTKMALNGKTVTNIAKVINNETINDKTIPTVGAIVKYVNANLQRLKIMKVMDEKVTLVRDDEGTNEETQQSAIVNANCKCDCKCDTKSDTKGDCKSDVKADVNANGKADGKADGRANSKGNDSANGKVDGKADGKDKDNGKSNVSADGKDDESANTGTPDATTSTDTDASTSTALPDCSISTIQTQDGHSILIDNSSSSISFKVDDQVIPVAASITDGLIVNNQYSLHNHKGVLCKFVFDTEGSTLASSTASSPNLPTVQPLEQNSVTISSSSFELNPDTPTLHGRFVELTGNVTNINGTYIPIVKLTDKLTTLVYGVIDSVLTHTFVKKNSIINIPDDGGIYINVLRKGVIDIPALDTSPEVGTILVASKSGQPVLKPEAIKFCLHRRLPLMKVIAKSDTHLIVDII